LIKLVQIWSILLLTAFAVNTVNAFPESRELKNILLINSYHQGYAWTDSLTAGIINAVKSHPEYNLVIENLNSKQFGKSRFEVEKEIIQKKYFGIPLAGVLVTDNDALDFALQYEKELFPNVPVVYAGIPNPEDYQLDGTFYYGLKETGSSQFVLALIQNLLPESRRLLVITDKTTNGMILRKEFILHASKSNHFSVVFPEVIDLDSIYKTVSSGKNFDAIFYIGLSQDRDGQLIDPVPVAQKIGELSSVPVFTNDLLYNNPGIVGGLFRNGHNHGIEAVNLLLELLNSKSRDSIRHIYTTTEQRCFFDQISLDKFQISKEYLPDNAVIFNKETPFTRKNFGVLLTILVVLSLIIIILSVVNRRRKNLQRRIVSQLKEIETQKLELESAHEQVSRVNLELEMANDRLKDANFSLMEAKKKAEESDNLKSAFLANVSHEIRTPLNSIVGFSSLLIEPEISEETKLMYASMIESNTESLLVLIDEIIDLSKIEAQQLSLKKQNFNVDVLLEELIQIFIQEQNKPDLELKTKRISPDKELFVFSDRVRVKQILINLMSNALKFTDSGFIELGYFQSENGEICLYVKDTGIGINKEHHQAIFHRFRKLNDNSSKVYRGTGLGLAITQKLVELLGGKIWIDSEPGNGATFYFTLQDCLLKEVNVE